MSCPHEMLRGLRRGQRGAGTATGSSIQSLGVPDSKFLGGTENKIPILRGALPLILSQVPPGCSERIDLQVRICCPAPRKTKKKNSSNSSSTLNFFKTENHTERVEGWICGWIQGKHMGVITWVFLRSGPLLPAYPSEVALTPDVAAPLTAFHI